MDTIVVAVAFDKGNENPIFSFSSVTHLFVYDNARSLRNDMLLLELEEQIGRQSGFVGIGFNTSESELVEELYFKFSYPGNFPNSSGEQIPNPGQNIYYRYGLTDFEDERILFLGISRLGEGGRPLIQVHPKGSYIA